MSEICRAKGDDVMLLACSGGSNVGQLTNQAAVELTREGFGKMFCLAGIGGGLQGFVKSAQDTPKVVVLDGCQVGCAKAIMKNANASMSAYIVVTDLGIEKVKDRALSMSPTEIDKVKLAVKAASPQGVPLLGAGCGCGCSAGK